MATIYLNGGNRWNILGFNQTKRDALSSVYKISMIQWCTVAPIYWVESESFSRNTVNFRVFLFKHILFST